LVCHPASATENSRFVDKHRVHREYRITVKKHLGEGSVSMRVEKVLALLVESGFVYCCVWVCIIVAESESTYVCGRDSRFTILIQILYPISAFEILPEPGPIVIQSLLLFVVVSQSTRATVQWPDTESSPLAQGSYPTLIVILVCIQKSPVDYYSTYSTRMQFTASPSFGSNKLGRMMPQRVLAIRRESVTDSQVRSATLASTLDEEKNV
jgi:hypothetical protein